MRYAVAAPLVRSRVSVVVALSAPRTMATPVVLQETVIVCVPLAPPPGAGLVTVNVSVVGVASSAAESVVLSEVELLNVLETVEPLMLTTDAATKPVPVRVTAVAPEPA